MKTSPEIDAIAPAYVAAQGALLPALKESVNPAFRSRYADFSSIWHVARPALAAQGLGALQEAVVTDASVEVTTRLIHTSGQWFEFEPLMIPLTKRDAHGIGSAITYAKRYALCAALGIVAEDDDDDGNAAVKPGYTVEAPASARASGVDPMDVPSSSASVPKAGASGDLTIRKVETQWEGVKGSIKGFVVLSDGRELPMYNDKLKTLCESLCQEGVAVEVVEKMSASGKTYLSSICRADIIDAVTEPLTNHDIPF